VLFVVFVVCQEKPLPPIKTVYHNPRRFYNTGVLQINRL
jgi:hypothetical protein